MNRIPFSPVSMIMVIFILLASVSESDAITPKAKKKKETLVHVVLVNFKLGTTAAQMARIDSLVRNMPSHIKEIKSLTWEKQIGLANETNEYSHILMVTFKSIDDLRAYDNHPEHLRVLGAVLPFKDKLLRFNYYK